MFSVRCPRHRHWVMLGPADILSLTPSPDSGFVIGYRCTCGYEGEWPPNRCEDAWNNRMAG